MKKIKNSSYNECKNCKVPGFGFCFFCVTGIDTDDDIWDKTVNEIDGTKLKQCYKEGYKMQKRL